jgi:hypothetical protein
MPVNILSSLHPRTLIADEIPVLSENSALKEAVSMWGAVKIIS